MSGVKMLAWRLLERAGSGWCGLAVDLRSMDRFAMTPAFRAFRGAKNAASGFLASLWFVDEEDGPSVYAARMSDWAFEDGPTTMAFLSKTVQTWEEAVTYVSHDADDGAWQFLGDRMAEGGGPVLVCLQHPVERDPSLKELADLPVGWCAERGAPGEPWIRSEMPLDDPL